MLGWGLSIAVILSLGLAALPVGAQGEMEWAEITTPSWEDEVIAPGADIFDYAIGSDEITINYFLPMPPRKLRSYLENRQEGKPI